MGANCYSNEGAEDDDLASNIEQLPPDVQPASEKNESHHPDVETKEEKADESGGVAYGSRASRWAPSSASHESKAS